LVRRFGVGLSGTVNDDGGGGVDFGAVSAELFGAVESVVGFFDKFVDVGGVEGFVDAADADGEGEASGGGGAGGFTDLAADAGGDGLDAGGGAGLDGHDDEEFLAAEASDGVVFADGGEELLGDVAEDGVADGMTVGVVDAFEEIDVRHEDAEMGMFAERAGVFAGEDFHNAITVPEAGEGIDEGAASFGGELGEEFVLGVFEGVGIQLGFGESGKIAESLEVVVGEVAGLVVDGTEDADAGSVEGLEGVTCVKGDLFGSGDVGIVGEARILAGIGDEHGLVAEDGVGAEGDLAGGFGQEGALDRFEPLAGLVDEGDGGNGDAEEAADEAGDAFEAFFEGGIEELGVSQCGEACGFIGRDGGFDHDAYSVKGGAHCFGARRRGS
jgi:hypothetical protein